MRHFLLSLVILASLSGYSQNTDKRLKGIEKELNELLETWKAAGFAVAVVEKDKLVYSAGFGMRDIENNLPVTPNTLFAIGSCSKAFTSALLGQLQNETDLSLDDSPIAYIPSFRFYNDEMNEQITIRDMMCHRTGLPRHDYSWYFFPTDNRDSLMARVEFQEPTFGVRERWQYNNFMFLAQGVIAEKLTGKSWETNIEERFFTPLGMSRSNLDISGLTADNDHAIGYEVKNDEQIRQMDYYEIRAMAPAGSINSSVNEMSNWVRAWINGGKWNGQQVIPEDYLKEAMSSQMVVNNGLPTSEMPDAYLSNYGFGWFLSSYKGHYRVEHGGNINGFSANTAFFPTDSIGIIVLANQNGSVIPGIARNMLADRMLGLKKTNWSEMLRKQREKQMAAQQEAVKSMISGKTEGTSPSHPSEDYAGVFENPAAGRLKIYWKNDSLFASSNQYKMWLRHYHYDVFEPLMMDKYGIDTTESMLRLVFQSDASGKITSLTLNIEQGIDPIVFKRGVEAIKVSSDQLEPYVGEYELSGMVAKVYIKDEKLHLTVPSQPEYELIPTKSNEFSIKGLDGFTVRFTEDQGTMTEAVFVQPNGTFIAKRK